MAPVGPKQDDMDIFPKDMIYPFASAGPYVNKQVSNKLNIGSTTGSAAAVQTQVSATNSIPFGKTRILVIMKGTVGAGKTTYSNAIQKKVEELGGICINEGVDKYCKTGMATHIAVQTIAQEFKKIPTIENNLVVVIVDTCGEKNNGDLMFDYNFSNWKKVTITPNYSQPKLKQYMAWSLRNVLNRPMHNNDTQYWLNPVGASAKVCIEVHLNKCKKLFGKKISQIVDPNTSLASALLAIESDAAEYQNYLNQSKPIDSELQSVYAKMGFVTVV